jgi:hypothetical protein
MKRPFFTMLMLAGAAGCSFSPKKQAPAMKLPASFKENKHWQM